MPMIDIQNLTFCYDGSYDNVFENVSLRLDTDWKLGFTGRNGRGKTTFLNLLMGKYEYRGVISASVSFDYFPFDVPDKSADTLDVIYSVCPGAELWQIQREISLMEVGDDTLYRPFSTLSEGERTKALLSALFLRENNFLLIDEPTNHLDMEGRETLGAYLNGKSGFILVSHDRALLDGCVDHILSINKADIEIQRGNFSSWMRNKELRDSYELGKNERLKREIKRLTETSREKADWSDKVEATKIGSHQGDRGRVGHLAAKMMKRSKAIEHRREREIEEKSKLLRNIESADSLSVQPLRYHTNNLAEISGLTVSYGEKAVFANLSLAINRGDRIALIGKNGCGKSSVLKLLAGEAIPHTGEIRTGSGLVVSYIPQDTSFLQGNVRDFAVKKGIDESQFMTILRKLDFSRLQFEKDMRDFSAGQRKKVLIAGSLCERAHLYIWDEPLNYIDVLSRVQIEALILSCGPAMLFVEHDRAFTDSIATKRIFMDSSENGFV